jgi:tRNA G18 (ribose-2'-O)-methylase SpoU
VSRRSARREKAARRQQVLQRYERQKLRNGLAAPGPLPYILVLDHLKAGYNVAKIFRSALAMGASAVYLVGIGPFDPAPAKGAFRKVPAHWYDDFQQLKDALAGQGYRWFAFSPQAATPLDELTLPAKSAFVFGHEEHGLSFDPEAHRDLRSVRIAQAGDIQSLNVSIAASIAMYEYVRQHRPAVGQTI